MTPAVIVPVVTESHCIWKSVLLTVQAALMGNGWLCSQYLSVRCNSLHASWQLCSESGAACSQVSQVKAKLQFDWVPLARWGKVRREGAAVNERAGLLSVTKHHLSCVGSPTLCFSLTQHACHMPRVHKLQRARAAMQLLTMCAWSQRKEAAHQASSFLTA